MNALMFIALVLGFLVLAVIGVILTTMVVYVITAIVVMTVLSITKKRVPKIIPQTLSKFNNHSNQTNYTTNSRWYGKYIEYFIHDYFRLFWSQNKIARTIFKRLYKCAYTYGYGEHFQDISDLSPVPICNKFLNSVHLANSTIGEKHASTTCKQNQKFSLLSNSVRICIIIARAKLPVAHII